MFTMGPVHTRDHDPECIVDTEPTARRRRGRVLLYAYSGRSNNRGASTPRGTPGGPQVELKFQLYNIPNVIVNTITIEVHEFPLTRYKLSFLLPIIYNYQFMRIARVGQACTRVREYMCNKSTIRISIIIFPNVIFMSHMLNMAGVR